MKDMHAMKRRQRLILHKVSRVSTSLSTLQGYVGEVRCSLQMQNDLLHKVELPIDSMKDNYLVMEYPASCT